MLHAALDLAPYRVLAIEERRVGGHDEELAVGAVGALRPRHRRDSALVGGTGEFRLEVGQVGTVIAGAGRVAALRHEARDDAMEYDIVVEAAVREVGDALDVTG